MMDASGNRIEGRGLVEWLSQRPRLRPAVKAQQTISDLA